MPCATIHLLIADGLLEDWARRPREAPFEVGKPEVRAAFLHGSLAPDMGFIPGVERLVSEFAHYVRPIRLARALLEGAEDPVDQAFAWGWIAHAIGDVELHPVVGRAVGERLHGDRDRRVDASEDPETHVSVEVGLDVAFLSQRPRVSPPPGAVHFDRGRVARFAGALGQTYGVGWNPAHLLRGHHRAVRLTSRWPLALRTLARGRRLETGEKDGSAAVIGGVLSLGARFASPGSATRGFLRPTRPPSWMIDEVRTAIETFPVRFRAIVADGLAAVPDRNLETGGPAGAGLGHPASDAAARKLQALVDLRGAAA